ncbi:hypothetical protein KM176_14225 [Pseudooceanicola sp. CBS1P-1]|uniref:Lipoprotein n=1 Tax=Pseudooceanicola albus TaxID=2692189 RepID=A0A6L7G2S2_9RHOB|nr:MULTISPECIES: hypothetical protein [Pseudooceanicola]MBT9385024.1 hypothetical protein [Pseudooceanicola endophyticus]MXN17982.1 hypothetical protein [Pseudooceanicola albus]
MSLKNLALAATLLVAACTAPGLMPFERQAIQDTVQYRIGSLKQMWVAPKPTLIMVQRDLGRDREQLIGLQNETTLPGDNFLWVRARASNGLSSVGRFTLAGLTERFGSVPAPFKKLDEQNLNSAEDSLGSYFWQEYRTGVSTVCVLAFRRTTSGARELPGNAADLEMLMRNCVNGTVQEALAPIRDTQISFGVISSPSAPQGGNRMLSPLAAPLQ